MSEAPGTTEEEANRDAYGGTGRLNTVFVSCTTVSHAEFDLSEDADRRRIITTGGGGGGDLKKQNCNCSFSSSSPSIIQAHSLSALKHEDHPKDDLGLNK